MSLRAQERVSVRENEITAPPNFASFLLTTLSDTVRRESWSKTDRERQSGRGRDGREEEMGGMLGRREVVVEDDEKEQEEEERLLRRNESGSADFYPTTFHPCFSRY